MASGMPISACVGRAEVMDAWPASAGEATHTQTFLGHPPSCAAALASIAVIEEEKLVERAARTGEAALARLRELLAGRAGIADVRGRGLLIARRRIRRWWRMGRRRKQQLERTTRTGRGIEQNVPAVLMHRAMHDRQAHPGTFADLFGREEWLEQRPLMFARDTRAIVVYG